MTAAVPLPFPMHALAMFVVARDARFRLLPRSVCEWSFAASCVPRRVSVIAGHVMCAVGPVALPVKDARVDAFRGAWPARYTHAMCQCRVGSFAGNWECVGTLS